MTSGKGRRGVIPRIRSVIIRNAIGECAVYEMEARPLKGRKVARFRAYNFDGTIASLKALPLHCCVKIYEFKSSIININYYSFMKNSLVIIYIDR